VDEIAEVCRLVCAVLGEARCRLVTERLGKGQRLETVTVAEACEDAARELRVAEELKHRVLPELASPPADHLSQVCDGPLDARPERPVAQVARVQSPWLTVLAGAGRLRDVLTSKGHAGCLQGRG